MNRDTNNSPLALIADDDEMMRLMLSEAASAAGFDVQVVEDGAAALDAAESCSPDLVLLDVNMPGMDGYSACIELRASPDHRLTPIVMVTGDDDAGSVDRAYECGATDFISKPINWSLLAHRLRYILRGAENLQALHEREQKIHKLAYYDELTGLPNRAKLRDDVMCMFAKASEDEYQVAVIHLDLNGFKRVNDSFGHKIGDRMLAAVGRRLSTSLQRSDLARNSDLTVARVAGDEFVAALCTRNAEKAAAAVAEIWLMCMDEPFTRSGVEIHMMPNIGIAHSPEHGDAVDTLLKNANAALNARKLSATGAYTAFCDTMQEDVVRRVELEGAIHEALRGNDLELHYQPKYCVRTGEIAGLEALLRWHTDDRGAVSPLEIIELAEESGLILEINRWVVDTACRQLRKWRDAGIAVPVAVNISGAEFLHGDPVALIRNACKRFEVNPKLLEVEITESTMLHDVEKACALLAKLKEMNVSVSVDDFGTGYSSLAYLKRFDIDTLKIDRSFVCGLGDNAEDRSICHAMLVLAKNLSLTVVAEGVETFDQHSWLAANGCDYVQGYYWSKPADADIVTGLLVESGCQGGTQSDRAANLK